MLSRRLAFSLCIVLAASAGLPTLASSTHAERVAVPAPPACAAALPAPAGGRPGPLAQASNSFAFTLFNRLFTAQKTGNTFISPVSISLALEMLYDGARGNTRNVMAHVLALHALSAAAVDADAAALIRSLEVGEPGESSTTGLGPSTPPTQLRIANSLWTQQGIPFQPQFLSNIARYFNARATSLEMGAPSAAQAINGWVSCATEGKIKKIVESTAGILMFLINAVYFQGAWSMPFFSGDTKRQPFTLPSGRPLTVSMMHERDWFPYYAGSDFQAVTLPYGLSHRFGMVIVLPRKGVSLAQFAPRLTRPAWGYWMKNMGSGKSDRYIDLSMPRIDLQYSKDLKASLKALGMGNAFADGADFSGVCEISCKISKVLHKTLLHVDEKGTVAAAVTAVGIVAGGGAPPPPPIPVVIDHPFVLGIRDGRTGAILFLGAINHP